MASTISAGTTSATALVHTADTSGALELKTNNGTTAVTIDTSQNVGIGGGTPASNPKLSMYGGIRFLSTEAASATYTGIGSIVSDTMSISTAGSERMRVTAGGDVGINTTSPNAKLEIKAASASQRQLQLTHFNSTDGWYFTADDTGGVLKTSRQGSSGLNGEAMRIDSSGNVLVGQTAQTSTEKFGVTQSATGSSAVRFYASSASYVNNIVEISCARSGATTEYNALCVFDNNTTLQMLIRPNGNLLNSNNSYGSLSDVSLKENIVDATPKLDDLMQVRVRNYNLKDDVNKTKQIGVVAQELETVFPGIIETDGEGIKAVKYSVFVPMMLKAIQEQQALITSLTARIAALEGTPA